MTTALIIAVVLLAGVSATLWFMLCMASEEIDRLENLMLWLGEQTAGGVLSSDAYCALTNEATDIREHQEKGDE